jgi:hypothetical protein
MTALSVVYAAGAWGADATQADSDTTKQVTELNNQKSLITAQKELIAAQKELITNQRDLVKEQAKNSGVLRQLTDVQAIAGTTVPTVGNAGTVSISESKDAILLKAQEGSLQMLSDLAANVCSNLPESYTYFIETRDFPARAAEAKIYLNDFDTLYNVTQDNEMRELVGLHPINAAEVHIAGVAAAIAAVDLISYGAGAVESLLKFFRTDVALQFKATDRSEWLPGVMSANCPEKVPVANASQQAFISALIGTGKSDSVLDKLAALQEFASNYTNTKAKESDELTKAQAELTKAKNAIDKAEKQKSLDAAKKRQTDRKDKLEVAVARMQTMLDSVAKNPKAFIDAVATSRLLNNMDAPASAKPAARLILNVAMQDAQVKKTRWWRSDAYYAQSYGELLYEAVASDGKVVKTGAVSAASSQGEMDVESVAGLIVTPKYALPEKKSARAGQSGNAAAPAP